MSMRAAIAGRVGEMDRSDEELFVRNMFSYTDRKRLSEHAYLSTRRDLLAHANAIGRVLRRHGLQLRRAVLEDEARRFQGAIHERRRRLQPVTGALHLALDRLETAVRSGLRA